jgi:hypothetical protein
MTLSAVLFVNSATLLLMALPDPEHSTLARLILTSAYVIAAWLWWRSGKNNATYGDSYLWRLGSTLLFLLAVNKLFNLRPVFAAGIRTIAKNGNWYDSRQPVQFVVAIVLPLLLAAIVVIFTLTKGKVFLGSRPAALAGWILLLLYLAMRQSQEWKPALAWLEAIHYRDWRIVMEVMGIVLLIGSAVRSRRSSSRV